MFLRDSPTYLSSNHLNETQSLLHLDPGPLPASPMVFISPHFEHMDNVWHSPTAVASPKKHADVPPAPGDQTQQKVKVTVVCKCRAKGRTEVVGREDGRAVPVSNICRLVGTLPSVLDNAIQN
jgi:hypothetical protein